MRPFGREAGRGIEMLLFYEIRHSWIDYSLWVRVHGFIQQNKKLATQLIFIIKNICVCVYGFVKSRRVGTSDWPTGCT